MQINFAQMLNRFGERTMVLDDRGRRYSYRQLRDMAADFCEVIAPLERALVLVRTVGTMDSRGLRHRYRNFSGRFSMTRHGWIFNARRYSAGDRSPPAGSVGQRSPDQH